MGKNLVGTGQAFRFGCCALGIDFFGDEDFDLKFFISAERRVGLVAFVVGLFDDILIFRQV